MTLAHFTQRLARAAVNHSPTILTLVGVAGTVTTAYLTGKASFEASDIIRLKEADDESRGETIEDPRERMKSRVELVWRLYIPPVTMGVATVACIIGGNRVAMNRAAGLAAAYAITDRTFEDYKSKVVEKFGEKKEQAVRDEIIHDRIQDSYDQGVEIVGGEGKLCFDMYSGMYFRTTREKIMEARNQFNAAVIRSESAPLGDFYMMLGVASPGFSENIGYNINRLMDIDIGSHLLPDGESTCMSMDFRKEPLPDYGRFR